MEQDYNTSETVSGEVEFPSSDVEETVSTETPGEQSSEATKDNFGEMSLKELNEYLGKNYPNKESALKSIKDTFSYVGKKIEKATDVDESKFISKEQYERDMFFSKNPDYDKPSVKTVLEAISKSQGLSIVDAAQTEAFKEVFGAVKGFSESQQLKSVLESNPRLASTKSKLSQANDAQNKGDLESARTLATKAVLEAYGNN